MMISKEKFEKDGYLTVDKIFEIDSIDKAYELSMKNFFELLKLIEENGLELGIGVKNGFKEIVQRHPKRYEMTYKMDLDYFDYFQNNPILVNLVSKILDTENPIVANRSLVISMPGSEDQTWHIDGPHMSLENDLPCHCLNLFIPLINVSLEHGPTEFRPGSQFYTRDLKRLFLIAAIKKSLRKIEAPQIKKGSVLLVKFILFFLNEVIGILLITIILIISLIIEFYIEGRQIQQMILGQF